MWGERSVPSESERSEDEGGTGMSEAKGERERDGAQDRRDTRARQESLGVFEETTRATGAGAEREPRGMGQRVAFQRRRGPITCPPLWRRFKLLEFLSPPIGTKDTTTLIDFLRHFSHQKTSYKIRNKVMTRMRFPSGFAFCVKGHFS